MGRRLSTPLSNLRSRVPLLETSGDQDIGSCHIRLHSRFRNPIPENASFGDFRSEGECRSTDIATMLLKAPFVGMD